MVSQKLNKTHRNLNLNSLAKREKLKDIIVKSPEILYRKSVKGFN